MNNHLVIGPAFMPCGFQFTDHMRLLREERQELVSERLQARRPLFAVNHLLDLQSGEFFKLNHNLIRHSRYSSACSRFRISAALAMISEKPSLSVICFTASVLRA